MNMEMRKVNLHIPSWTRRVQGSIGCVPGNFAIIDGKDFTVKGKWTDFDTPFGYDFWYQPRLDVMISSEWGFPNHIRKGLSIDDVASGNALYPLRDQNEDTILAFRQIWPCIARLELDPAQASEKDRPRTRSLDAVGGPFSA